MCTLYDVNYAKFKLKSVNQNKLVNVIAWTKMSDFGLLFILPRFLKNVFLNTASEMLHFVEKLIPKLLAQSRILALFSYYFVIHTFFNHIILIT